MIDRAVALLRLDALPKWGRWLLAVGAVLATWAIAAALLPSGAPREIVLQGVLFGSANALMAFGLILIWRANRVVNFAVSAMGGLAGGIGIHLFRDWGWNYWLSLPLGVIFGAALGLIIEFVVIRRFEKASRLVVIVATIGLTQLLGGVDLILGDKVFDNGSIFSGAFTTPLSSHTRNIGLLVFNGDHLLIVIVVPLVALALGWFLRRSMAGQGIRAAAENGERARLVGIPVRRLQTLVWIIAGALAALTTQLSAPFAGQINSAATGPTLILPALAAAVVARMESLPVAFGAALTLGAMDQVVRWNLESSQWGLVDVIFLVVIILALVLQRSSRSRAFDSDAGWQDGGTGRSIPAVMRRLPEIKVAIWGGTALLIAAAVVVPLWLSDGDNTSLTLMAIWGMVAVSLVVLTGWSGQISLGQFAFVGVGAMVTGNLVVRQNLDLFLALALAALAGGLIALIQGIPAMRISGPFLAVVTLAFAVVFDGYLLNQNVFPGLVHTDIERPVLLNRWPLENSRTMFYLCAAMLALVVLAARGVRRARSGRLLIASRDNRKAAEAMAVWSRRQTLTGFLFAGMVAGLAGGLHVLVLHGSAVGSYPPDSSVQGFSMATIGGLGSLGGALIGAIGIRGLNDAVSSNVRLILDGTGVLLILWLLPGGIGQLLTAVRDWLLRLVARRRNLHVPGLTDVHTTEDLPPAPEPVAALPGATADAVAAGPPALVECRNIDVSYGQLQVLFSVDFQVAPGEIVALLGTNGAGKSTLLRALVGLTSSKGVRRVGDIDLTKRSVEQVCTDGVALMPGGRSIFPTLTVTENLKLATWTFRHDHDRIHTDTESVLDLFPVLRTRLNQLAGNLSGGEQQQLALAQTLLLRPKVLLIDELSLGLAPSIVAQLIEVVRSIWRSGTTIVVVEQSVNVALALAERAVFLEKGTVRFEGPTSELLERPDILRSVFIHGAAGQAEVAPTSDSDGDAGLAVASNGNGNGSSGNGASNPFGAVQLGDAPVDIRDKATGVVLECRGVTKRFGGIVAVDGVDLIVGAGEIVGLIGQNGAGKTTLLDCISGFHDISGGHVLFRTRDITTWSPFERASAGLGRSFQEARLFPSLTVAETVAVARERHVESRSTIADALRQPASFESELITARRVHELLGLLGLGDHADKRTSELSTGMRRIVELACLLAEDPTVLLLDEPSAGVAQKETEALGPLLKRMRDHTGAALVIIEHDMPLLSGVCDRMVALELGAVIAVGSPEQVLANDRVIASYLGTDDVAIQRSGTVTP